MSKPINVISTRILHNTHGKICIGLPTQWVTQPSGLPYSSLPDSKQSYLTIYSVLKSEGETATRQRDIPLKSCNAPDILISSVNNLWALSIQMKSTKIYDWEEAN